MQSALQKLIALLLIAVSFASAASPCAEFADVPAEVQARRLILFGELHGTTEGPAAVGEFVCGLLEAGATVTLVLEWPAAMQLPLQLYLRSSGDDADVQALLANSFWTRSFQDGRSSKAMLKLAERARSLVSLGRKLTVHAPGGGSSEEMAAALRRVIDANPNSQVVSLTGNAHASRVKGRGGNPNIEPMGFHLRDLSPYAISLEFESGTAWVCVAGECGPRRMTGRFRCAGTGRGFHVGGSSLPGYDACIQLGSASDSPPAGRVVR
jgi:hypothetical protein